MKILTSQHSEDEITAAVDELVKASRPQLRARVLEHERMRKGLEIIARGDSSLHDVGATQFFAQNLLGQEHPK